MHSVVKFAVASVMGARTGKKQHSGGEIMCVTAL